MLYMNQLIIADSGDMKPQTCDRMESHWVENIDSVTDETLIPSHIYFCPESVV